MLLRKPQYHPPSAPKIQTVIAGVKIAPTLSVYGDQAVVKHPSSVGIVRIVFKANVSEWMSAAWKIARLSAHAIHANLDNVLGISHAALITLIVANVRHALNNDVKRFQHAACLTMIVNHVTNARTIMFASPWIIVAKRMKIALFAKIA